MANSAALSAISQIEKAFGKSSIVSNSDHIAPPIDTGSMYLNSILGGGWPRGTFVEIMGDTDTYKSTLGLASIASAQRNGMSCAFIDADKHYDPHYAESLGVDISSLIALDPENGEQSIEMIKMLAESGEVDLIVVDSVDALTPRHLINTPLGEEMAGVQARMISAALRKLVNVIHKNHTTILFTNQIRYAIPKKDSDPVQIVTAGGNALRSYVKLRIQLARGMTFVDENREACGAVIGACALKNLMGKRGAMANMYFEANGTISHSDDLLELGLRHNIITTFKDIDDEGTDSWYLMNALTLGQGRLAARSALADYADARDFLLNALRELGINYQPNVAINGAEIVQPKALPAPVS